MKGCTKQRAKTVSQRKNSRSSEGTSNKYADDDLISLVFALGTPTMHKQQARQAQKQEDQELQLEVEDRGENADSDDSEENVELDAAFDDLMMLEQSGILPFKNMKDISAYVDNMLAEKISRADFAK